MYGQLKVLLPVISWGEEVASPNDQVTRLDSAAGADLTMNGNDETLSTWNLHVLPVLAWLKTNLWAFL